MTTLTNLAKRLDAFTYSYLQTLLWAETDDSDPNGSGGDPLDKNYDLSDFAPEAIERAVADCRRFQEENADALQERSAERGGHDFWLNRNGHGAGFWDGDWPINGERLDAAAHTFGECYATVGDDGQIYLN